MSAYEVTSDTGVLDEQDIKIMAKHAAEDLGLDGKKVLLIIPDKAGTCPLNMVLSSINWVFKPKVERLDLLVASGNNAPLALNEIYEYLEIDEKTHKETYAKTEIFNHNFDDPRHLSELGLITKQGMEKVSDGKLSYEIGAVTNKVVLNYDLLVIVGPSLPHKTLGFSGGNDYLFPGLADQKFMDFLNKLGDLDSSQETGDTIAAPVRDVIDYCASMIPIAKFCFSLVATEKGLHGIFAGTPEDAYKSAADLSSKVHSA